MPMGIAGFRFSDLFVPERLKDLYGAFCTELEQTAPEDAKLYASWRAGAFAKPEEISTAILAVAPHVSRFVGRLFGVEKEIAELASEVKDREPLWVFKADFAKKRVLKDSAGKAWKGTLAEAGAVATAAITAMFPQRPEAILRGTQSYPDEELAVAKAVIMLVQVDDTARKAAKAGGAAWTDELRERASIVRRALASSFSASRVSEEACAVAEEGAPTDAEQHKVVAFALDAIEAWLAHRRKDHHDHAFHWPSLRVAKTVDHQHLVELRRPEPKLQELFVGPDHERRERDGFPLTDRRGDPRQIEQEIDYCLYCHERDKDSCSKGLRDNKTNEIKKNPLGVALDGCPLDEKISEMHVVRRGGDALGALAIVAIDNPMCPGTGHRICNDCMKACVFQKQEPVNIPQIETRVLTEVLSLPWGLEIYGLLTRWNPLDVRRPYALPYNGKNVLVVGLGPAGYTLAHHLTREGFGVSAIDGLKIEPLPAELTGSWSGATWTPPLPIKDFGTLYEELDERVLLGFGGVSEYGITVRWDKNFLTLLYITLARKQLLRIYGGIRFGGTMTLDDAWSLGFDHVALAAGAGRPTIIDIKNNLAKGIRKASDFLMALQLTGAYKRSSIANLQIQLPAIVIGGGLTAIDTATELLAYYPIQVEKVAQRVHDLVATQGPEAVRAMFDEEEWAELEVQLQHAKELEEERALAAKEGRDPLLQPLLDKWGGVWLVYRRSVLESPAYRLNHEEVQKSLEEGVRYVENLSPTEAVLDPYGHVKAVKFRRAHAPVESDDGTLPEEVELPARTVCVAAGTSPNTMYEKEYEGTFALDAKKQYFQAFSATVEGDVATLAKVDGRSSSEAFFTSYAKDGRKLVSFYGDNHPFYAGSVVKAMASAKHGFLHVGRLFPEVEALANDTVGQPARNARLADFFASLDDALVARVVEVNRLTKTIVEVVVKAPMAARKFKPGQFYRLQNFESFAPVVAGTRLGMEGLALTGAWIDEEKGLLGTIVLEMGGSSRLCAALRPGEPIVLMGPTGTPTHVQKSETSLLLGGGLGNAVLFSIARAMKALGNEVLYFAGYKKGEDLFKQDDIEAYTDQVIWCTDTGAEIAPRRPQDRHFRGNIVQACVAYGKGELGERLVKLPKVNRIIAIGSDRMMAAVKEARHGVLQPFLDPLHVAIGSINSPMQCMMKEVCAQCLQKHTDPKTGKETLVFSCYNQDQELDAVDFKHLHDRLRANSMQEKVANAWLDRLLEKNPELLRI
ncbi:MAG: FAD-dependent oxidoreductase [Labilithrix sp.]|nr:FAD-dependent oxidoreductase [Labilithrix sp.]MCW5814257.1 FAD-dependent oxidoreductase [Labilithrix sp.]